MFAVGIDLGTTNSAIATMKGRPSIVEDLFGNRTTPSAIGWDEDLEELVVGIDAKESPDVYTTVLSVKRKMGTDEKTRIGPNSWLPEEVSAEILKHLMRQVEEKAGEKVTDAVITVPAYFQMAQTAATKRAGELAGLKVHQLLAEPSAAIMAYGPQDDEKILVYDLGGGTFDVTITDYFAGILTTLSVFGNNRLGGDDLDLRLINHFLTLIENEHGIRLDLKNDLHAASVLKKSAETAKIEMSRKKGARITIPKITEIDGRPIGLETVVKTDEFNTMIQDLVESTMQEVQRALDHAKLKAENIDTVLLVGGSTYVPLVQKMVGEFFGKVPDKSVNPDLAVAMGAAASLIHEPGDKHVVTVRFVPETTPDEELELEGRTTPSSTIRITGGADKVEAEADETGTYEVTVPLKQGMNTLAIVATSPDGEKASLEPEPVVHDTSAKTVEEPPAPPQPRLARALSMSCGLNLAPDRIASEAAVVILPPQTELPTSFSSDRFATAADNQTMLVGQILEGDLPHWPLNTKLADIHLALPPNVPANERVIVHFSVDENYILTAELEVPSVHRKGEVKVSLQSSGTQKHVFQSIEDSLVQWGDHLIPEDRASIEQSRVALEDLASVFCKAYEQLQMGGTDVNLLWDTYNRVVEEGRKVNQRLNQFRAKYG